MRALLSAFLILIAALPALDAGAAVVAVCDGAESSEYTGACTVPFRFVDVGSVVGTDKIYVGINSSDVGGFYSWELTINGSYQLRSAANSSHYTASCAAGTGGYSESMGGYHVAVCGTGYDGTWVPAAISTLSGGSGGGGGGSSYCGANTSWNGSACVAPSGSSYCGTNATWNGTSCVGPESEMEETNTLLEQILSLLSFGDGSFDPVEAGKWWAFGFTIVFAGWLVGWSIAEVISMVRKGR